MPLNPTLKELPWNEDILISSKSFYLLQSPARVLEIIIDFDDGRLDDIPTPLGCTVEASTAQFKTKCCFLKQIPITTTAIKAKKIPMYSSRVRCKTSQPLCLINAH